MPNIPAHELKDFAFRLLQAGGFRDADALQTADLLIWANLRGIDSHGVLRIPRYIEMVEQGTMVSGGAINSVREFGAVAVLDGGKCPGAVGMNVAVNRAEELARRLGVGWCAARAISHAGAIGYFASALAGRGLIGLVMSASKPLMSYFGATGEALSTNPLSIAVPVRARILSCLTCPQRRWPSARSWRPKMHAGRSRSAGRQTRPEPRQRTRTVSRRFCRWQAPKALVFR